MKHVSFKSGFESRVRFAV